VAINKDRVLAAYHELVAQTGSYIIARALVIQRFKLSAAEAERVLPS
jgi:hypothetical protein